MRAFLRLPGLGVNSLVHHCKATRTQLLPFRAYWMPRVAATLWVGYTASEVRWLGCLEGSPWDLRRGRSDRRWGVVSRRQRLPRIYANICYARSIQARAGNRVYFWFIGRGPWSERRCSRFGADATLKNSGH